MSVIKNINFINVVHVDELRIVAVRAKRNIGKCSIVLNVLSVKFVFIIMYYYIFKSISIQQALFSADSYTANLIDNCMCD